ncbi:kit ligand a [Cynoglossus semilaevis]|uniref:Kit ligand n=1 Tax=Cynoglossus semilaevis TaxID=244447 RepID=A0A3P8X2D1_CYNSE|nr:kit ligand [Cynoglossus semilaevis]
MKRSKIWIRVCVYLLLFITLEVHSSKFDVNPVTDDITTLAILRHNIPEDYKIPVRYVPKEEGVMCWVKLNVYYLEESLTDLSQKFGNISTNRKDISIFIQMLQELRLNMGSLEPIMFEFECHYREEKWQTARYFDFVKTFLLAAQNREDSDDCTPLPCPTTPYQAEEYLKESPMSATEDPVYSPVGNDTLREGRLMSAVLERSLFSLLLIPLLGLICLIVWKIRSRRTLEDPEQNPAANRLYSEPEWALPPLDQTTEKNKLNVIASV